MPVSYGQPYQAPSDISQFLSSGGMQGIASMLQKFKDKKQMDTLMSSLDQSPEGVAMKNTPEFKIAASQGPRVLMQALLAGRITPPKQQTTMASMFGGEPMYKDRMITSEGVAGPVTAEGKKPEAPTTLGAIKGTPLELADIMKAYEQPILKKAETEEKLKLGEQRIQLQRDSLAQRHQDLLTRVKGSMDTMKMRLQFAKGDKNLSFAANMANSRIKGIELRANTITKEIEGVQKEFDAKILKSPEEVDKRLTPLFAEMRDLDLQREQIENTMNMMIPMTPTGGAGGGGPAGGAGAKGPSKSDFMSAARKSNPGVPDADLEKYWNEKYGGVK